MPDDGQQLDTSLSSNSSPYYYLHKEEGYGVLQRVGLIAPFYGIWGKCLYSMYWPSGGGGGEVGVGDSSRSGFNSESQLQPLASRRKYQRICFSVSLHFFD